MNRLKVVILEAVALLVLLAAPAVQAHSFPEAENPPAGATLQAPPPRITIKYDAPIEKLFASLQVLDPTGRNEAEGAPTVGPDGRTLSVEVPKLPPGQYTVKWGVVCIDSHHTEGSYQFTVGSAK
jgi:methionine-rich copper-binding protein CopC